MCVVIILIRLWTVRRFKTVRCIKPCQRRRLCKAQLVKAQTSGGFLQVNCPFRHGIFLLGVNVPYFSPNLITIQRVSRVLTLSVWQGAVKFPLARDSWNLNVFLLMSFALEQQSKQTQRLIPVFVNCRVFFLLTAHCIRHSFRKLGH